MTQAKGTMQIVEVGSKKKLSSNNYMNREACDRWKEPELKKFFMGLQLFGTDFGMIETLFEGTRTRAQIKVSINLLAHFSLFIEQIHEGAEAESKENHPAA